MMAKHRVVFLLSASALVLSQANADLPTASAALETIKALDTDGSGKVERAEVEAFARSQGLSADEVREEFKGLDKNGDGELEPEELTSTLADAQNSVSSKEEQGAHDTKRDVKVDGGKSDAALKESKGELDVKRDTDVKPHDLKEVDPYLMSSSEPAALTNSSVEASDMERDARLQARRTLAQVFAHRAEEVLAQRSKDEEGAAALEKLAEALRANASELVQKAPGAAERAAVDAADAAAKRTLGQAKKLEESASKAEAEAGEKREQALVAMNSALKAQNEMTSFVRRLRAGA